MTDARIIAEHWVCGDGCCSGTDYSVETDCEEYSDFASLSSAMSFCDDKGWTYVVEDIYPEDV